MSTHHLPHVEVATHATAQQKVDAFFQAKALLGDDYVILTRAQVARLIAWANSRQGLAEVDPNEIFGLWLKEDVFAS